MVYLTEMVPQCINEEKDKRVGIHMLLTLRTYIEHFVGDFELVPDVKENNNFPRHQYAAFDKETWILSVYYKPCQCRNLEQHVHSSGPLLWHQCIQCSRPSVIRINYGGAKLRGISRQDAAAVYHDILGHIKEQEGINHFYGYE